MNMFIEYLTTDMKAWELLAEFQKPETATPPKVNENDNEQRRYYDEVRTER